MVPRYSPTWFTAALFGAADATHISTAWIDGLSLQGIPGPVITSLHMAGVAAFVLVSIKLAWHFIAWIAIGLRYCATVLDAVHKGCEAAATWVYCVIKERFVATLRRTLAWLGDQ